MNKKKTAQPDPENRSRRGFFSKIWMLLGGAAVLEAGWVVSDFFGARHPPGGATDEGSIFVAGPTERFAPGTVTAFPRGKFYLVRLEGGGYLALSRKCTHLGCTVPWDDEQKRFVCPCHASSFDISGAVQSPPAPRPLDLFHVRIENNIVKVDLAAPVERRAFSEDQVVRA